MNAKNMAVKETSPSWTKDKQIFFFLISVVSKNSEIRSHIAHMNEHLQAPDVIGQLYPRVDIFNRSLWYYLIYNS